MSRSRNNMILQKSASCQMYRHLNSTSSEASTSTSSSDNSDNPLRRFNRLLRSSVARHWFYFRKDRARLTPRGRSVSDTGLCGIGDDDPVVAYLDIPSTVSARRSLQTFGIDSSRVPRLSVTSAGGSSSAVGAEEASDGSDAERPRKGHHLRVPAPAFQGQ